jgi:ribosome recycling factor
MPASNDVVKETKQRMEKTLEATKHDFAGVRTGKANPQLLESIKVDYYGSMMPLDQVATISAPEPNMIVVQPWDKNALQPIVKAIQGSDLGLNPNSDGNIIRLVIPALNEERRKEFVKIVRKMAEDGRIAIRNERRDAIERLRRLEKDKEVSEDDSHRLQKESQDLTDEYIKKIDAAVDGKEEEIMQV